MGFSICFLFSYICSWSLTTPKINSDLCSKNLPSCTYNLLQTFLIYIWHLSYSSLMNLSETTIFAYTINSRILLSRIDNFVCIFTVGLIIFYCLKYISRYLEKNSFLILSNSLNSYILHNSFTNHFNHSHIFVITIICNISLWLYSFGIINYSTKCVYLIF